MELPQNSPTPFMIQLLAQVRRFGPLWTILNILGVSHSFPSPPFSTDGWVTGRKGSGPGEGGEGVPISI